MASAVGDAPNGFCEGLPKRGEMTILRAPLRSYNDRFHHLCKVTRTLSVALIQSVLGAGSRSLF